MGCGSSNHWAHSQHLLRGPEKSPKLSARNTGYLVTQTQFIKNSLLTSSPFLPCQMQDEQKINKAQNRLNYLKPMSGDFFFFLTNGEFYSVPSNSGYIVLHIFQANCHHPRQGHLSASKSISLSHMFENRQAFSKLSQKSRGKEGEENLFQKSL